jgi:hypothetical protein
VDDQASTPPHPEARRSRTLTTVTRRSAYGAPGVDVKLSKDFTTATTAVYGSGTNGHCTWMGARFPNLTEGRRPGVPARSEPCSSLATGRPGSRRSPRSCAAVSTARSSPTTPTTAPTSTTSSSSRTAPGSPSTAIVGAQTWEAAFQPGANQGSIAAPTSTRSTRTPGDPQAALQRARRGRRPQPQLRPDGAPRRGLRPVRQQRLEEPRPHAPRSRSSTATTRPASRHDHADHRPGRGSGSTSRRDEHPRAELPRRRRSCCTSSAGSDWQAGPSR